MNDKTQKTLIDLALIATFLLLVLAPFSEQIRWYHWLLPIPIAFLLAVVFHLARGIYERYRTK